MWASDVRWVGKEGRGWILVRLPPVRFRQISFTSFLHSLLPLQTSIEAYDGPLVPFLFLQPLFFDRTNCYLNTHTPDLSPPPSLPSTIFPFPGRHVSRRSVDQPLRFVDATFSIDSDLFLEAVTCAKAKREKREQIVSFSGSTFCRISWLLAFLFCFVFFLNLLLCPFEGFFVVFVFGNSRGGCVSPLNGFPCVIEEGSCVFKLQRIDHLDVFVRFVCLCFEGERR